MCGLVGIAGPSLGIREKRAFLNLFYSSGLRGLHAAGCLFLTKKDITEESKSTLYYRILRKASPVTDFFGDSEFKKGVQDY